MWSAEESWSDPTFDFEEVSIGVNYVPLPDRE